MQTKPHCLLVLRTFAVIAMLVFSGFTSADPPSRVARLGYTTGAVSFSPGGESDWVKATINRPLTSGDRLWVDARARAEIQVGGAMIRLNAHTSVTILNLDDQIAQLQLTQGTLNVRVRRLERNQVFEVDTPNLAFTLRQPGEYRIEVDADGNATTLDIRRGRGEVYGEGASYMVDSRQPYRFTGAGLREYEYLDVLRLDEFDRWASDRDRRYDSSGSARYVSSDVVGYEDLDANGTWRADATYGHVWYPNRVEAGWAPYRDGHWAWVDPWGWTWVDDAPWGFAVSHYGRWANLDGGWGWVPGPVRARAYYAPALVAFVGDDNFQLRISTGNVGGIGWFPLAPREIYRPSYAVSRGYFENINVSNTTVNTTVINNYYNNSNVTNVVYANRQVAGAVIAVPTTAFVQSQPVSRAAVQVSREMLVSAPVAVVPRVAPTERSVRGAAVQGDRPPARVFERPVVARSAPPAAHAGFAAQQQQLNAAPGKPLDEAARTQLRPAAAVPAPVVNVVVPAQVAPPTVLPPRVAPAARAGDGRERSDDRRFPAAMPGVSGAAPQAAPPPPTVQTPDQRGRPDQRGNAEPRTQPFAPTPPPPRAAESKAVPPVAPVAPAAQPAEQRGAGEQRAQPFAPAPPPPRAAEPKAVPPVVPAAPAMQQPPPQRAKPEPAPAIQQAEPRPPVAMPKAPPVPSQPTPKAEPRGQEPKADAGDAKDKKKDKKKDAEEQKRDEDSRK